MKQQLIILILLALICSWSTVLAQDNSAQSAKLTVDQQKAVDDVIAMDPKLSTEEVEHLKLAVLGAPTKAEPISDSRMVTQPEPVHAPWKAEPIEERADAIAQPPAVTAPSGATNTQPIPEKSENAPTQTKTEVTSDQPVPAANQGIKTGLKRNGPKDQPPADPEKK